MWRAIFDPADMPTWWYYTSQVLVGVVGGIGIVHLVVWALS